MNPCDVLVTGGLIRTLGAAAPVAEALAVRDGRVVAVGRASDVDPLAGPRTRRLHLEGGVLLPGFVDAHVHVWKVGQLLTGVLDLRGLGSLDAVYAAVADRVRDTPRGSWIVGRGWNEVAFPDRARPTRAGLDRVAPDHPVLLTRTCAHLHVANGAALAEAGIDARTRPPGGGTLSAETGLLAETAVGLVQSVIPPASPDDLRRFVLAGAHHLRSLGVTSVTEAGVDPALYRAYDALHAEGSLPLHVDLLHLLRPDVGSALLPLPPPRPDSGLRCDTVKLFADGGLSGATAALSEPYRTPEGGCGILRLSSGEILDLARHAARAGYRVATHAIGDRALEATLQAYARLHDAGEARPRPRIEHFGMPCPEHLAQARRLGVHVVTQPIFLRELAANFRASLPERLLARCYPLRSLRDAAVAFAYSSDGPVVRNLSPLAGIAAAVGEPVAEGEGVTVADALAAYTTGAATAQGRPGDGRLAVGCRADAVWLDRDPLATPADEMESLSVRGTLVAGQ